ncbi:MAG: multiple antibiotic resistance (MarC)-related protein [Labilithrix sp.]|nr:multiple antibiotic resistance (MarC)-related protein [Labilithrix sp.]
MLRAIIAAFSAVFSVADPLGLVPVYLAMTAGWAPARRRRTAVVASGAMFVTLTLFAAVGPSILHFFGLSLGAFRIAGGCLLFLMAVDMLRAQPALKRTTPEELAESHHGDIAIFPLAFPMLAGPGAIANAMMQTSRVEAVWEKTAIYIAIGLASVATLIVLLVASFAEKRLGKTGLSVLERVMGLMLAAIAVQFIVDGVGDVLPALRIAAASS